MIRIAGGIVVVGMTGGALGGCTCISIGVAFLAIDGLVSTCQSEVGSTVVEHIVGTTRRMTGQTGRIIVLIAVYPIVLLICIRIRMATDTGEIGVIGRILVTIGTLTPFTLVFTAVNGKQHIVLLKIGRHPVRIGGMAGGTLIRKMQQLVIRVCGALVIGLVTGKTVSRGRGVVARGMATGAVLNIMPLGQREKVVPDTLCIPAISRHVVTFGAIGGKPCLCVIRVGCPVVVLSMTVDTGVAQTVETKHGFRLVAFIAVRTRMGTREREAILLVKSEYIVYLPVICMVAPRTIITHRCLVQVGMTGNTIG
jgi:hypothetical protein